LAERKGQACLPSGSRETEGKIDGAMEGAAVFRTVALVVIVVAPMHAASAAPCMTESEARRAYSTAHLYWHGADHCWDASPGRLRSSGKPRHHFVRQHRDEDEVVKAQPKPVLQAQPQLVAQAQLVAQPDPQSAKESTPLPMLTSADLIRAGHTRMIEELESKLRDRWSDTRMEFQAKPSLIEVATADAPSTVSVGLVILSIGGILVIWTMLVSFGAKVEQRRQA
jgi:hypothetical protein